MSNYEELIRPEFEVQCKKLGRGIERGVHSGEYASLPTYDAWEALKSATSPLLAALEEKDQEMNKTKDHLQDVERVRDAFAAEAHHLSAIAKQLPSAERRVGELLLRAEAAEQRLQQPIKLPKREIGMACEFVSDHIVVSLAAVLAETATAGFKAEVEGE
jgi:hypothetical protein